MGKGVEIEEATEHLRRKVSKCPGEQAINKVKQNSERKTLENFFATPISKRITSTSGFSRMVLQPKLLKWLC